LSNDGSLSPSIVINHAITPIDKENIDNSVTDDGKMVNKNTRPGSMLTNNQQQPHFSSYVHSGMNQKAR